MFRFVALALAALSLCVSPATAEPRSTPFVDHFRTLCDEGEGDGARALALARDAGWAALPASMFEGDDNPFDDVVAMMNAEPDGTVVLLMTGHMTQDYEGSPMKMSVCGVMGGDVENSKPMSPDPAPVVRDWLAMSPHPDFSRDGLTGYVFTRRDGRRQSLADASDAAGLQAALKGEMHVIMIGEQSEMSMILYMRPSF